MSSPPVRGEEGLIQGYLAALAEGYPGAFALRDDCAAITPRPGHDLVVKTDPIAAGVHFLDDDPPESIAWKALAVNVSDLVAKGATPVAYLMALSFPEAPTEAWMAAFAKGLKAAQECFGMHLVGGDTDRRTGPITISITVFGEVATGTMIRRGGAQPGDHVCVCGAIGDAAVGLQLRTGRISGPGLGLSPHEARRLMQRSERPTPDLALIPLLRRHARAAMDISDGLAKDLGRMCRTSGVGARVATDRIPISAGAATVFQRRPDLLVPSVTAGDDYVVLAAVPAERIDAFLADANEGQARMAASIGTFTAGAAMEFRKPDGTCWEIRDTGWDHF